MILILVGACGGTMTPGVQGAAVHELGQSCKSASDCASGLQCATEDPGGQCYKTCRQSQDADCGDTTKYACSFEGHCYLKCNQTSDCPRAAEGYVCKNDQPARGVMFCDVAN
jgi:hypothetical protein